jgi:mRNA-degrading endonuclease RelE of RelBE toxin-antitoxin system
MAQVDMMPQAARQLERLPEVIHQRVLRVLERLEKWPDVSGAKPLSGDLAGHYRVRTGDYRVQIQVRGSLVIVEKIGHRDGFYED